MLFDTREYIITDIREEENNTMQYNLCGPIIILCDIELYIMLYAISGRYR